MIDYVELHCHSAFSLLDGASTPEALVKRAHELGYRALAITDHNELGGVVRFAGACEFNGMGGIIGSELTVDVPANVRAEVRVPNADARAYAAQGDGGARFVRDEDGVSVFTVGSGHTSFAPAKQDDGGSTGGDPNPGTPGPAAPGAPAPTPAPAPDRTAPRLSGVRRVGGVRVRTRVTVRLRTTEAGRLRTSLVRLVPGRRSGKACRALGSRDHRRSTCTATVAAATPASVVVAAGTHRVRLDTRRLKAGRYRATLAVTDAAGNRSDARTVAFTVVRR